MGVLRGIGYFLASVILIIGILFLPVGIVLIIPAIIWMWYLHKGGQLTAIQKEMKRIRQIKELETQYKLNKQAIDMRRGWETDTSNDIF